ncbi:D-sedoheptulose 7-phosphate isomerase [Anaeroselena agilis]|uniref:Phosphoheptose isomerase n=1 Tax=Anaeroselena agilis TaxID=3063788 RepID=A0ABU3P474_9FIRM|nr:D-sedoheptulose 7-phosphate isomerase [Selenomonadales bacterium 4137-cl]
MDNQAMKNIAEAVFAEHDMVIAATRGQLLDEIVRLGALFAHAVKNGNCIFFMGNGGSAADSQHLAAEFVGRFQKERRGLPAIALSTDTSILTAVGNDYGFDAVFARQVEALAKAGDVVVGLSTSGNSPNVVKALQAAKAAGAVAVGMTGRSGGKMAAICDLCIMVPADVTARIQEAHALIGHIACQLVDGEAGGV